MPRRIFGIVPVVLPAGKVNDLAHATRELVRAPNNLVPSKSPYYPQRIVLALRQPAQGIVLHTLEVGITKRSGIVASLITESTAATKSACPGQSLHAFGMVGRQQNVVGVVLFPLGHLVGCVTHCPAGDSLSNRVLRVLHLCENRFTPVGFYGFSFGDADEFDHCGNATSE